MQFQCKHCERNVNKGEPTTAIISGTLGEASLDDFKNFYVFHETCFVEVGGEEYSPAIAAATKAQQEQKEERRRAMGQCL